MLAAEIRFADGTKPVISTDSSWLVRLNGSYTASRSFDASIVPDEYMNAQEIFNFWHTETAPIPVCTESKVSTKITLAPGEKKTVALDVTTVPDGEWYFNLFFELKENCPWAKTGHIIAKSQFIVNEFMNRKTSLEGKKMVVKTNYGSVTVSGGDLSVSFSRRNGALYSVRKNGRELLRGDLKLNFWRALTDNDRGNKQEVRCGCWRKAGQYAWMGIQNVEEVENAVKVYVDFSAPTAPETRGSLVYTITSVGIHIDYTVNVPEGLPEIPEISMIIPLKKEYDKLNQHEPYQDNSY